MALPSDIDTECIELCETINLIPGLQTVESCCGHGTREFAIWLIAEHIDALRPLLYYIDT